MCWRTGLVGLAVLGDAWKPVLSVNTLLLSLQLLFHEPNMDASLEGEARLFWKSCQGGDHKCAHMGPCLCFAETVQKTMHGGVFFQSVWPSVLSLKEDTVKQEKTRTGELKDNKSKESRRNEPVLDPRGHKRSRSRDRVSVYSDNRDQESDHTGKRTKEQIKSIDLAPLAVFCKLDNSSPRLHECMSTLRVVDML